MSGVRESSPHAGRPGLSGLDHMCSVQKKESFDKNVIETKSKRENLERRHCSKNKRLFFKPWFQKQLPQLEQLLEVQKLEKQLVSFPKPVRKSE